jgi:acyl-CoA hydrolase
MKTVSPDRIQSALASLPPNPRVVTSGNAATPWTSVQLLDQALETYTLNILNAAKGVPDRDGVSLETSFVGPGARRSPSLAYVPARLSMVPLLYGSTMPPDAVLLHTSLPHHGKISLGAEVNVLPAAIEAAQSHGGVVIAQMDPDVPYVFGDGEIALDQVDWALEACDPLGSPAHPAADHSAAAIADQVAARIQDGATLQLGIGAVPDAVLAGLRDRSHLRVWSEMVSDGILALERSGSLDRDVPLTASFLFGSPELYAWADKNPRIRLLRTETTNNPAKISQNPSMVSVNTALQVDLFGQVNASRIGARIHSGFGGQTDFIVGALHADRGQAIIALRSWHPKADVSTIVPLVDEPVTSFQPSAVVTEQGVAALWGHTEKEQARQLIENAAHPSVREELHEEAVALGLAADA